MIYDGKKAGDEVKTEIFTPKNRNEQEQALLKDRPE